MAGLGLLSEGLEGSVSKWRPSSHGSPIAARIAGVVCQRLHATTEQRSSCASGRRGCLQEVARVCTMAGRPLLLAGLEGLRLVGSLGCEPVCRAGFVAGTRVHTPSHGWLPAGPTREVAFHGRGTQGGRELSVAGGASHQLWCCSGGRSIQESTSYHACGERVPSACGGLAVPARLPVMRPVPSLQGRCAGNIGATHEEAGVGRVLAGGWPT